MKVTIKNEECVLPLFNDIDTGVAFVHKGELYLKVSPYSDACGTYNAYNLKKWHKEFFISHTQVVVVKELIVVI